MLSPGRPMILYWRRYGKAGGCRIKKRKRARKENREKRRSPIPGGRKSEEDKKQRKVLVRGERIKRIPEKKQSGKEIRNRECGLIAQPVRAHA